MGLSLLCLLSNFFLHLNKYIYTLTSFSGQYNAVSLCNILGAGNLGAAVKSGGGRIIVQVPLGFSFLNENLINQKKVCKKKSFAKNISMALSWPFYWGLSVGVSQLAIPQLAHPSVESLNFHLSVGVSQLSRSRTGLFIQSGWFSLWPFQPRRFSE
jgi:hypothetical protein